MSRVGARAGSISAVERAGFGLVLTLALVFSYQSPADSAAWLLLLLSFPLFLLDPSIRSDSRLRWAIWIVLCSHHFVALLFAYGGMDISIDAESFHRNAVKVVAERQVWTYAIDFDFYVQLTGHLYLWLGGGSRLLGAQFAVFAFVIATVLFIRVLELFDVNRFVCLSVILFGCLPSVLVHTSIPLRESLELALLIMYCFLMFIFIRQPKKVTLLWLFVVIAFFGVLHKALILYSLFLAMLILGYTAWLTYRKEAALSVLFTAVTVPAGMFIAIVLISKYDFQNSGIAHHFLSGNLLEALEKGRAVLSKEHPRTAFGSDIDFSTLSGFLVSYPKVYVSYMFSPFPWQIENVKDLVASLEGLLRLGLVLGLIIGVARKVQDPKALLLILIYFSMTVLWALGTTNYGQALRHHVLTNWILIVVGLPCLVDVLTGLPGRIMPEERPG